MSLSTQPYKGARDFYPEDKRVQKYMFWVLRNVVERFGYQEYDAPLIEPFELYAAKTGEEIVNDQLYSFEDRKGRKIAIRPEMTPSVSRMVAARRQELAYPLRLYSIPNLWRYERPQRGRLREHWQLNVDLFGVDGVEADIEIIQVADAILKSFGANAEMYEIRVNSRLAMKELLEQKGYSDEVVPKIIGAFDRLGKETFHSYMSANFSEQDAKQLDDFINSTSGEDILDTDSGKRLAQVIARLRTLGINARPDISINRGFDYYTDIVFEVFDTTKENNRSMFGGGRYDGLVNLFGVDPVATVGFGMGDVTLQNFLEAHNLLPALKAETHANVLLIGDVYDQAQAVIGKLRGLGLNLAVDSTARKTDAKLKNAAKSGVNFVIFIGEEELASGQPKLKNLSSGEEETLAPEKLAQAVLNA